MFSEVKKNMMGRNHLLLGLGLYGGTILAFDIHQDSSILMGCLASAGLGSLLPDIDSPHSYIGRKFWPVSWVVSSAVRHRGVTHSLFALLFLLGILCLDLGKTSVEVRFGKSYVLLISSGPYFCANLGSTFFLKALDVVL